MDFMSGLRRPLAQNHAEPVAPIGNSTRKIQEPFVGDLYYTPPTKGLHDDMFALATLYLAIARFGNPHDRHLTEMNRILGHTLPKLDLAIAKAQLAATFQLRHSPDWAPHGYHALRNQLSDEIAADRCRSDRGNFGYF